MKKIFLALFLTVISLSASAQFEQYTSYFNTSMTALNMHFNSKEKFNLGLDATGGVFVQDAWMIYGRVGYDHRDSYDKFSLGAGGRYYIEQNGLYMNLGLKYQYINTPGYNKINNIFLTPEVGYCFYLNHYVSLEPAVYYDISMNHFSDFSSVGLRIGFGFYF